jgi:hypothetical protein
MADIKLISRRRCDQIVDDLLNKYPKGPKGLLKKEHYTIHESWSYRARRYKKYVKLPEDLWCAYGNSDSFGYGDELLSMVQYHISNAGGTRSYLEVRDADAKGGALTRRSNRIEQRVGTASKRFIEAGDRGIYKVDNDSTVSLYVIANSDKSAQFLAKTMLATSGIIQKRHMYTRKIAVASTELLKTYTDMSHKRSLSRAKSLKDEIEKNKVKIIALSHLSEAIKDFGDIQPAMLSDESGP